MNNYMLLIVIVAFFSTTAFFCGLIFEKSTGKIHDLIMTLIIGYITLTGIFLLISFPFMLFKLSFLPLVCLTVSIIVGVYIYGIVLLFKKNIRDKLFENKIKDISNLNKVLLIAIIVVVLFQIVCIVILKHTDLDDTFYLSIINTTVNNGFVHKIDNASGIGDFIYQVNYLLVSFELLLSVIVKLFNVNTAFLCHTIVPVFFIILHYLIIFEIAKLIDKDKCYFFVLAYSILVLFSGYSSYMQTTFLIYRIWQGKTVLVAIVLPSMLLIFGHINERKKLDNQNILMLLFSLLSGFHSSVVGLSLTPIAYFAYTGSYSITHRKIKHILKLCIPVLCILPYVIIKFILLKSKTGLPDASGLVEQISWIKIFKYNIFSGNNVMMIIFIISVFIILIKGTKIERTVFVLPIVVLVITFLNPVLDTTIAAKITGSPVYWRLFWLLNIPICIIDAVVIISRILESKLYQITIFTTAAIIFICNGSFIFKEPAFVKTDNIYKLDQNVVTLVDEIQKDCNNKNVTILAPSWLSYEVREYCGNITTPINRYTKEKNYINAYGDNKQYDILINHLYNPIYLDKKFDSVGGLKSLKEIHINYLVVYRDISINNHGIKYVTAFDKYKIYRVIY